MKLYNQSYFTKDGKPNKALSRRFQSILEKVVVSANRDEDGDFVIPAEILDEAQSTLNKNLSNKDVDKQGKIKERYKKRIRKRKSYYFWADMVSRAKFPDEQLAYQFFFLFWRKFDQHRIYGSLTHSKYDLESLQLAVEDSYKADGLNDEFMEGMGLGHANNKWFYGRGDEQDANLEELEDDFLIPF